MFYVKISRKTYKRKISSYENGYKKTCRFVEEFERSLKLEIWNLRERV